MNKLRVWILASGLVKIGLASVITELIRLFLFVYTEVAMSLAQVSVSRSHQSAKATDARPQCTNPHSWRFR